MGTLTIEKEITQQEIAVTVGAVTVAVEIIQNITVEVS